MPVSLRHSRLIRLFASVLAAGLLLVACGDDSSPEDDARSDGEALGEAIAGLGAIQVEDLDNGDAVESQLETIDGAADELLADRADTIGAQVEEVQGITSDTVAAVSLAVSAGNFGDAAAALEEGLAELEDAITGFADSNDSVSQAAWEGVETGLKSGSD